MSLVITGATIIDAVAENPVHGSSMWIEGGRIKAIDKPELLGAPPSATVIDARGKYVIPGLIDANVHLLLDIRLENLVRYEHRFVDLIVEAAQVTLRNGLTTVFDTWGPREALIEARDGIKAGKLIGSRIFCAGNIIGLGGPYTPDFFRHTLDVASGDFVEKMNSLWSENVGPELGWMTSEQVGSEVRDYLRCGIDFVKYAASEYRGFEPNAFLALSPHSQAAIVEEAHRAGTTAQAHTSSVEGLRSAIEAGSDIIQHCNVNGPTPIPDYTLQLLREREVASTVFPFTKRRFDWIKEKCSPSLIHHFSSVDINLRNLIDVDATLLMATDAGLHAAEMTTDPLLRNNWTVGAEDNLAELGEGHFHWLKGMEEKGYPPMKILQAATKNTAIAYKKDQDIGTLEPGKIADILILDKDPLKSAENYRSIAMILKDGLVVDRSRLPDNRVLT